MSAPCSPQRFLPNNLNLFRDAVLTPSSVLPVENQVQGIKTPRSGTAQATLTGTYTGTEPATYEIQIADTDVEVPRVSTPTFAGAGSGTISAITATGTQQIYTVELSNAGTQTTPAAVALEGTTIEALVTGSVGNLIRITVDQSGLVFAPSNFSLLEGLSAGAGAPNNPLLGAAFDWDDAVMNQDGLIPLTAHRVAFGDDHTFVYLAYKQFKNGQWEYHLSPQLQHDVPRGTIVQFVTGGRTVSISDGLATEVYPDIETAYDLLYALRTQSALVVVNGVVANDRSPTGQAARELTLRTDAHAEVSYGSGAYTRGFEDVTVAAGAGTQLVTATCFAVTSADSPLARLGAERWALKSSLLGDLGDIVTGRPYAEPSGEFGLTIPVILPPGYGLLKGQFTFVPPINYGSGHGATLPGICPVSLVLGPDAVDQTITVTYRIRPTGDCDCSNIPAPRIGGPCLGNTTEGGGLMAYQPDTVAKMVSLHLWYTELVRSWTTMGQAGLHLTALGLPAAEAPAIANPVDGSAPATASNAYYAQATESIKAVVANFESAIAQIDAITPASPPAYREAGMTAWDTAVAEFQSDILVSSPPSYFINIPSDRYDARLNWVLMSAGIPTVGGADASTLQSGDGCWRDYGGSAWWEVVGNVKGAYAPAFSNKPYISCRPASEGGYFSTHEFGFQINVACVELLREGDSVTLQIAGASQGSTYQVGDQLTLPIIAAAPLYLTGGADGSPVQTWNVNGTVSGPLAPYSYDPDAPAPYSVTGLGFTLTPGGIPFAKGDRFRFAIEGGHWRWRKDGGDWQGGSPPAAIPLGTVALDAGLSLAFVAGAAASFVAGDVFAFRALQPWAVSNTQTPSSAVWKWSGATATYAAEFTGPQALGMVAILHDLPAGATVTLWGGATAPATDWSEMLTYRPGVIWSVIDRTAEYVRIEVTGATGGSIQWPWIGVPLTTELSSEVQLRRGYQMNRPGGNLQGGRCVGKTVSGDVSWTESALTEADVLALAAMLDHVKANNDEPILFIPQVTRTADPVLFARINSDDVEFPDFMAYNQNQVFGRRVSASIPLAGVWQ